MDFSDRLINRIVEKKSYLCMGLDPQLRYIPPQILKYCAKRFKPGFEASAEAIFMFNTAIINASIENAACYKPQMAFYQKYGSHGVLAFERTVDYLYANEQLVIEDAKLEDGGDSADAYADGHLGGVEVIDENGELEMVVSPYDVDAITITAWIDEPVIMPFVKVAKSHSKGIFVLAKTSFKPASKFQEMEDASGEKGWVKMAKLIGEIGKDFVGSHGYSSIGVVMGATYPEEAELMREILPNAIKLIPGFGYQGGGADDAVTCFNSDGFGGIVNNSRATNYAWHPKFKSEFICDPKYFATAAFRETEKAKNALNAAMLKKNGSLPW